MPDTTVAFLLEYKSDGMPGRSGPGDALRLSHALRHPRWRGTRIRLFTTVPAPTLSGFFENCEVVPITPTSETLVGRINPVDLGGHLDRARLESCRNVNVIHAFIGEDANPFKLATGTTPLGLHFVRKRIDSSSLMCHDTWPAISALRSTERRLAVAIRSLRSYCGRNSPRWFPELVRDIARTEGFQVAWFGDVKEHDHRLDEVLLGYQGLTFSEQICRLRRVASCAVGWNSGGLDLAAAAGLPVLRVAEFQGSRVPEDDGDPIPIEEWPRTYNSFLAVATTIGLPPRVHNSEKFDQTLLAESLRSFLRNQSHLQEARHVILPQGDRLADSQSDLTAQLRTHST